MAFHRQIQRLLLVGVRFEALPAPARAEPPAKLLPLIEAVAPEHRLFDSKAVEFGHRYRSGFWIIYLLSAVAVLFAVLPLAMGWDSKGHALHPFVGLWALGEVVIIATVGVIYWRGHHADWQGQWLLARTTAELAWYLPLVAPLVDFDRATDADWYLRVFDPGQHLQGSEDVETMCRRLEPLARALLGTAWNDAQFISSYAAWAVAILEGQAHYHHGVAIKQHALQHRVHGINNWLFGSTAIGALMHLVFHTLWLSLVTTFFPALVASLHGALAQSESYRLAVTSERLRDDLLAGIRRIHEVCAANAALDSQALKDSIKAALGLILEEHQDWHMLVRPHHLPLA